MACFTTARMELLAWFLQVQTPGRGGRCRNENHIYAGHTHIQEGLDNTIDQMYSLEYKTPSSPHNYQENEDLFGSGG